MLNATDDIKDALKQRAHNQSRPFCYSDYITVEVDDQGKAFCPKCGSDDLMRELDGMGVEFGYEWIMEHIVETEGEPVDVEELYRDLLDECYAEVKFGDFTYSPSLVLESVDPTAFRIGVSEYADSLICDGLAIELNGRYYNMQSCQDIQE
ncbi:MAG TPA: hypothetical protein V6C86_26505 [Oculatellaceae cyanobacterium]